MELLEHSFKVVVLCAGASYLTLGLLLLLLDIHKGEWYKSYRLSEKLFGCAYLCMSATLFAWYVQFANDWHTYDRAIACADVILYYATGMFMSYAFANLLDMTYASRRRVRNDIARWAVASAAAMLAQFSFVGALAPALMSLSILMFLWFIIGFLAYFRRLTLNSRELFDNYFSNDVLRFVAWINRSIGLVVLAGFVGIVSMYSGIVLNWIYQVYMISVNFYIALCFINHGECHGRLREALASFAEDRANRKRQEELEQMAAADPRRTDLDRKLKVWIAARRYTENSFTVEELARWLNTNKLYMSQFINEEYGVNFRTWISHLRVDDAKRMMLEHPELKIEEIAYQVGFSSPSYFSRVFAGKEGVSPAQWRQRNAKISEE